MPNPGQYSSYETENLEMVLLNSTAVSISFFDSHCCDYEFENYSCTVVNHLSLKP